MSTRAEKPEVEKSYDEKCPEGPGWYGSSEGLGLEKRHVWLRTARSRERAEAREDKRAELGRTYQRLRAVVEKACCGTRLTESECEILRAAMESYADLSARYQRI